MSPATLRVGLALALATALAASAPAAWAQGAPVRSEPADRLAQARDEARRLAEQALTVLDSDPGKARALFEQAEAKFHAPTHLLYIAQALTALGDLEAAARTYQKLAQETVPNYAPNAFREAKRIGGEELAALVPKLTRVRLSTRPDGVDVGYQVDGLPVDVYGKELLLGPGRHVVRASTREGSATTRTVVAVPGAVLDLQLDLAPAAVEPESESHAIVYVGAAVLATSGIALTAALITGVRSMVLVDQLNDLCPDKVRCDPADAHLADDARVLGNVSTGMWAAFGVLGATGTALLVYDAFDAPEAAPSGRVTLKPVVGAGYVGLMGRF